MSNQLNYCFKIKAFKNLKKMMLNFQKYPNLIENVKIVSDKYERFFYFYKIKENRKKLFNKLIFYKKLFFFRKITIIFKKFKFV